MDRVMDALFASNHEESQPQTVARSVHDARRLRKAGDLDGALAVFASVEPDKTAPNEMRWAYAEWQDLVRRGFGQSEALVYSQGAGKAAALAPPRRRDRGSPGRAGDALADRQASVQAQPAGSEAPERRWVMVVANTQVDLEALKSRHPLGGPGGGVGRPSQGKGPRPPGRLLLPPGGRGPDPSRCLGLAGLAVVLRS